MIWLNPARVVFGGQALSHVESVVVDRVSSKLLLERGDGGPHVVFADVPEQRVTVRVVRRAVEADSVEVSPGELGVLSFDRSLNASSSVERVTISQAVVTGVTHRLERSGDARQTVEFVAVSSDGSSDPVQRVSQEQEGWSWEAHSAVWRFSTPGRNGSRWVVGAN